MSVQDIVKNFGKNPDPLLAPKPFSQPKPFKNDAKNKSMKPSNENNNASQGILLSSNDIQKKLSQMQKKRVPPPNVPGKQPNKPATPEFLRKSLKPVGQATPGDSVNAAVVDNQQNGGDSNENVPKANIRDSILLFEKSKAEVKPEVKPKPRTLSRNSGIQKAITELQNASSNDNSCDTSSESKSSQENMSDVPVLETIPPKGVKPSCITLCSIPKGLEEWMKVIIAERTKPKLVAPIINRSLKPSSFKSNQVLPMETAGYEEDNIELSDDVESAVECEELYDDAAAVDKEEETEDIYDDVENVILPTASGTAVQNNAETEELYDDAGAIIDSGMDGELYDDAGAAPTQLLEEEQDEELYDDVGSLHLEVEAQEPEVEGALSEQIYEPVESVNTYVASIRRSQSDDSVLSEKDDKKLKKEKQKEEKRRKKEEQERKKKEEQERKRQEKERKQFNLKVEGDLVSIERHVTVKEYKGKGKELNFGNGELVDVISKDNCPKGRWLARNMEGRLGYISLKSIGLDEAYEKTQATNIQSSGNEFFYEEVGKDVPPPLPVTPRPGYAPALSLPEPEEQEEDLYEAI